VVGVALVLAALAGACSTPVFECAGNAECAAGGSDGVCEATSRCSFADTGCESGRRYGEYSGDLSGVCTDETSSGIDAGIDPTIRYLGSVSSQVLNVGATSMSLDTTPLPAAEEGRRRLVLLSVSSKEFIPVVSVTGASTWTRIADQCSGMGVTGASVWWAETSTGETIDVAMSTTIPASGVLLALAFEVPPNATGFELLARANDQGVEGACGSGVGQALFSVPATPMHEGSTVLVVIAPRYHIASPDGGMVLASTRAEGTNNGSVSGITVIDYPRAALTEGVATGSTGVVEDFWAAVSFELY